MAYIRAIASGNYSAPSTWNGGVVPGAGDIACCGSYRVTLDVSDVLATLSATNVDWVAAGGTTLATTHTGGFTTIANTSYTIAGYRYSFYGSAKSGALSFTVGDFIVQPTGANNSFVLNSATFVAEGTQTLTFSIAIVCPAGSTTNIIVPDITGLPDYVSTWINGSCLLGHYNSSSTYNGGTINLTTGHFYNAAKTGTTHGLLYSTGTNTVFNWTVNGIILQGISTSYYSAAMSSDCNLTINAAEIGSTTCSLGGYALYASSIRSFVCNSSTFTVKSAATSGAVVFKLNSATGYTPTLAFNSLVIYAKTVFSGVYLSLGNLSVTISGANIAYCDFSACINVTVTGDVSFVSTLTVGYGGYVIALGNFPVTIGGNVTFSGVLMRCFKISTTGTSSANYTGLLWIKGSIDLSAATVVSATAGYSTFIGGDAGQSRPLRIDGDIIPPTTGTILITSAVIYLTGVSVNTAPITLNGNIHAGVIPCLTLATDSLSSITINGDATAIDGYPPQVLWLDATYTFIPATVNGVITDSPNGLSPISTKFILGSSAELYVADTTGVRRYIPSDVGTIPAITDVRDGVAVGSGVGTLVVPSAANVLEGIAFDGTVGTLAIPSADIAAIKAQTDQLQFDVDGNVLASGTSGGSGTDYTARFDTIDAAQTTAQNSLNAANTAIAVIKSKTDQLTFTSGLVNANTPATDYTARFDTLETMVGYIPTVNYTARLNTIDATLDTIYGAVTAGGTDLTPVTTQLNTMQATLNTVYNKAVQFTFTANGVVADAEVSVNQAINYDTRFDTIDAGIAGIRAKTDDLTFDTVGVIASATVDLAGYEDRFTALDNAVGRLMERDDLVLRLDDIDSALATISNATGAVDLEPISAALTSIYTSVQAIPRLTYGGDFAVVNAKLDAIPTEQATVDLTEVTDGIADVQTAVNAIPTTVYTSVLDSIIAKLNSLIANQNNVDFTTVLAAIESSRVLIAQVKSLVQSDSTDLTPVMTALDELLAKFAGVDAPVTVIPAGSAGTTTLYGYCYQANGVVLAGEEVTCAVTTACGTGKFVLPTTQTSTSDATGLVTFQVPRHDGLVVSISYGGNTEEVIITGLATQEMPAIVKS